MEHRCPCKANICLCDKTIYNPLLNINVHYHIHESLPWPAILIELDPVYNIGTKSSNINLILPAHTFPASIPHAMTLTPSVI